MTIQAVIMNRGTLIFASDFRGTIDEYKSYTGIKKIFKLDETQPIGIMINGLMDFENVPLETLIKEFKENINDYKNIREIRDDFIKFLSKNTKYTSMENIIKEKLISFKTKLTKTINKYGFDETINNKEYTIIPDFLKKYSNFKNEFKDIIPEGYEKNEYNITIWEIFSYSLNFEGSSIIIGGFDKIQHYPSLFVFNLYCNDNGEIIWHEVESIENCEQSLIRIYAINDEAYTFITGISPDFEENIAQYIKNSNRNIITDIEQRLKNENIESPNRITKIFEEIINIEYSDFNEYVSNLKSESVNFTSNLLDFLPRWLLCNFADNLIKLTALKQQISLDLETVSSESDILLFTKSDKPKWIKYNNEIL